MSVHHHLLPTSDRGHAAVFVDLENIYYELKKIAPDREVTDYILTVIRKLGGRLEQADAGTPIIAKAYADFERLDTSPQGSLYLMGVETHNVMSTEHKNSADMRLCIDALEVLYTRPEIQTFVLIAGDRDYIPLVQHLRRQGRQVFVSSFRSNLSGDLLQNIEKGKFIDALELLSEEERREIEISRQRTESISSNGSRLRKIAWQPIHATSEPSPMPVVPTDSTLYSSALPHPPTMNGRADQITKIVPAATNGAEAPISPPKEKHVDLIPITDDTTKRALTVMLDHFGQHAEVWMSPLLWKLSNAMPLLADFERKVLINNLEASGAVRVVKRPGKPHDYSAVVINYNHPTVRECMP